MARLLVVLPVTPVPRDQDVLNIMYLLENKCLHLQWFYIRLLESLFYFVNKSYGICAPSRYSLRANLSFFPLEFLSVAVVISHTERNLINFLKGIPFSEPKSLTSTY